MVQMQMLTTSDYLEKKILSNIFDINKKKTLIEICLNFFLHSFEFGKM